MEVFWTLEEEKGEKKKIYGTKHAQIYEREVGIYTQMLE